MSYLVPHLHYLHHSHLFIHTLALLIPQIYIHHYSHYSYNLHLHLHFTSLLFTESHLISDYYLQYHRFHTFYIFRFIVSTHSSLYSL